MADPSPAIPQGIGAPIDPVEHERLLRGEGRFVADLVTDDTLSVAFVRSTVAAGRIVDIDTAAAAAVPGVIGAFTARDLMPQLGVIPASAPKGGRFAERMMLQVRPRDVEPLAIDQVRHVGQAVAVVVADDRYAAEDGVAAVAVQFEERPPVVDATQALALGGPPVYPDCPDNVAVRLGFTKGERTQPAGDTLTVEQTYRIGRQTGLSIECRGAVARCGAEGRIEVWSSTQAPFVLRSALCAALGWREDEVRVRSPDVGGGFGPKVAPCAEDVVVAHLARRLGRAVSWVEDRYENLVAAPQARDQVHRARLTVTADGRIVAWEDDFVVDLGVHNPWMVGVVANTAIHLLGPYRIPWVRVEGTGVFTNKAPTSQYRGAGRPEATFALERSLDEAAGRLGLDRWKLREINVLDERDLPFAQDVPYRDDVDIVYDGNDYRKVLDAARRLISEAEVEELRTRTRGWRLGVGVAACMEATGRGPAEPETARVFLDGSGDLQVRTGTGPSGQSHETVFAQIAADASKRGFPEVHVSTGDTDGVPQGLGSFASRSAVIAGSAVQLATEGVVERVIEALSRNHPGADVRHVPGGFVLRAGGTERTVTWQDVAARAGDFADSPPLTAVVTYAPPTVTWTMGVHVAVVAVDPSSGRVRVLRYGVAHETGPALNPRVVVGQVRGGAAQGIGGALLEEVRYDPSGQPLSATLADYLIPLASDLPRFDLAEFEVPTGRNPLGIRGVGESGTIPGYAVIASAVDDAVGPARAPVTCVPIDPEGVVEALLGS